MTQASNLAQAIDKLMQSKLDSSLRERYFILYQDLSPSQSRNIINNTTESGFANYIDIGPDDIISIKAPYDRKTGAYAGQNFEGKISEAIDLGYVEGNFIFVYGEPQE